MDQKIIRRSVLLCVLAILWVLPVRGDFAIGGEFMELSRDLELGSLKAESESSDALAVFIGFDVGNSMLYLRYFREESHFQELLSDYEKSEFSLDWHWNEETSKKNFLNTSVGIFLTTYDIAPGIEADFVGLSGGGGITRFLGGPFFFNVRGKGRLAVGDDEKLFPTNDTDDEQNSFFGYEAQAAFGFLFGRKLSWSIQLGYKIQATEFEERFVDDENRHVFLTTRFFVPFGH